MVEFVNACEGVDVNKTSASNECDIFHHWHFIYKRFKIQFDVCNGCHDVLMTSINLNDIAILNIRGVDYCCIINGNSRSDTVNLLLNADLTEERSNTQRKTNYFLFFIYIYIYIYIHIYIYIYIRNIYIYNIWQFWSWKTNFTKAKIQF